MLVFEDSSQLTESSNPVFEFSILSQLFQISFLVMENFDFDPFLSKTIAFYYITNLLFPCVSCSNTDSFVAKVYLMHFAVRVFQSPHHLFCPDLSFFLPQSTTKREKIDKILFCSIDI